jgi:virulence-associated protein VagC
MILAEIVRADGGQSIKLPGGFELEGNLVSIRRHGKAIILEPVRPEAWPPGFFDQIRINDPEFKRPPQGDVPPAPTLA